MYANDEYDGTVGTVQLVQNWTVDPDAAEPWEDDYSDRSFA